MKHGSLVATWFLLPSILWPVIAGAETPGEVWVCSSGETVVEPGQPELQSEYESHLTVASPAPCFSGSESAKAATLPPQPSEPWGLEVPLHQVQPGWSSIETASPCSPSPRRHESLGAVVRRWLGPAAGRHRGLGCPLEGESWLDEPLSASWFIGAMQGSTVIKDWIEVDTGIAGGFRLGGDVGHYWGFETRLICAELGVNDYPAAIAAQWEADTAAGMDEDDPRRQRYDTGREATFIQWDLSILYYPWGESAWRPYVAAGIGQADIDLEDRLSRRLDKTLLAVPVAVGLKYRFADRMVLRMEVADMIGISSNSQFETLHNLTGSVGAEFRFGGNRRAYWPWNPGKYYW